MDYIFIVSKYLEGLELLLSCTVCIEWRSRLLKDWKMWKRRLYEDYGPMKRIKRTVNNVTTFSWRDTYLMKVNEEATSELKYCLVRRSWKKTERITKRKFSGIL